MKQGFNKKIVSGVVNSLGEIVSGRISYQFQIVAKNSTPVPFSFSFPLFKDAPTKPRYNCSLIHLCYILNTLTMICYQFNVFFIYLCSDYVLPSRKIKRYFI